MRRVSCITDAELIHMVQAAASSYQAPVARTGGSFGSGSSGGSRFSQPAPPNKPAMPPPAPVSGGYGRGGPRPSGETSATLLSWLAILRPQALDEAIIFLHQRAGTKACTKGRASCEGGPACMPAALPCLSSQGHAIESSQDQCLPSRSVFASRWGSASARTACSQQVLHIHRPSAGQ